MRPIQARQYYHMLVSADTHGSYHECPEIARNLVSALGIKVEVPGEFGWGSVGSFKGLVSKALLKQYPFELLVTLFNEFFHVVVFEDRVDIIGRDLVDGAKKTIRCKTGIADMVVVGYVSSCLDAYSYSIKKSIGEPCLK